MQADSYILNLAHVPFQSKKLLPDKSGIYYIVDNSDVVLYIGQAQSLQKRWGGKSHHRLHQLNKWKNKPLKIYFELINQSSLDAKEKQQIDKYRPLLNETKVTSKQIRPSETLLRETLTILSDHIFILGIEPPRSQDMDYVKKCSDYPRKQWLIKKQVLGLSIIHLCLNITEIEQLVNNKKAAYSVLKQIFTPRRSHSYKWEFLKHRRIHPDFFCKRLLVNSYAVEIYNTNQQVADLINEYEFKTVAGVRIKCVSDKDLEMIKTKALLSTNQLYIPERFDDSEYQKLCRQSLQRVENYHTDPIKVLFNEAIKVKSINEMLQVANEQYKIDQRGLGSRDKKDNPLPDLLSDRGIDQDRYKNYAYRAKGTDRIKVYVKSFTNLTKDLRFGSGNLIKGAKGISGQSINNCIYANVYMLSSVDRLGWLLLEPYLSEFTKVELTEDDGYIEKVYISARKYITPSKINITIGDKSFAIPFGPSQDNMSYEQTQQVVKEKLGKSGILNLKVSFTAESVTS